MKKLLGNSYVDTSEDWKLLGLSPQRNFIDSVPEMVEKAFSDETVR